MVISTPWEVPDAAKKERPTNKAVIPKTREDFLIDFTPLEFIGLH